MIFQPFSTRRLTPGISDGAGDAMTVRGAASMEEV
jgi:hypothetical protein